MSCHDDLCCCVVYSNVEKQVEILNLLSLIMMLKNKWLSLILDVDLMALPILKLEFSFKFLEFIVYLRVSSQNFMENHQGYFII